MRNMLIALLVALAMAPGCRKGPDSGELQTRVQETLDGSFQEGLFKVEKLTRRGSYPYTEDGDERDRLLVYYDADIRFLNDYKLSDWDKLNVGSLISVLGATPQGVSGVEPGGNSEGDLLEVYGTAAYVMDGDAWTKTVLKPKARGEGGEEQGEELPYQKQLAELDQIARELVKGKSKQDVREMERELANALAAARRRLGRSKDWVTMATGTPSGEYYKLGKALEGVYRDSWQEAMAFQTAGSMENVTLVNRGEVGFAFVQNDIAYMAHSGVDLFKDVPPMSNLRALCSLYPEAVQVVTLKSSGIDSLAGLEGKAINVGSPDSGVRANAIQLLESAGLSLADFSKVSSGSIGRAVAELERGEVQAIFITAAYPAGALTELAGTHHLKLISLDEGLRDRVLAQHPFFIPITIPANSYPGVDEDYRTVGVTAMLVTHQATPADKIEDFLGHLFDNVQDLSRGSLMAYYISKDPAKAMAGVSIPMHSAAKAYLER